MNDHAWIFRVASVLALIVGVYVLFTYNPPPKRWTAETRRRWAEDVAAITERLVASPDEIRDGWWRLADRFVNHPEPNRALSEWLSSAPQSLTVDRCGEGLVVYRMALMVEDEKQAAWIERAAQTLDVFLQSHPNSDYFHWYTFGMALQQLNQFDRALVAFTRVDEQLDKVEAQLDSSRLIHQTSHLLRTYAQAGILGEGRHALKRLARGVERWEHQDSLVREIVLQLDSLADGGREMLALDALHTMLGAQSGRRGGGSAMDWYTLGYILREHGEESLARDAWERHLSGNERRLLESGNRLSLYNLACYRALAGDRLGAIDMLDRAVEAGWRNLDRTLADTDLDSLRADERFQMVLDRMRLIAAARQAPDSTQQPQERFVP